MSGAYFFSKSQKLQLRTWFPWKREEIWKNEMHFQYTVFGPLDEFHGFIQICYYECPHISGIYLESLLIALTTINGYVSQNACKYTTKQFLKFIHLLVGGNISQLVYLTPHPRFWSSDCLHTMKWLWSITLLKMMKMSYNPDIFCLFTLISHLKYLRWWVGGNLSQLVYLAPHLDFWAVIGYGFWIATSCCDNY